MRVWCCFCLGFLMILSGCTIVTRHGDARVRDNANFPFHAIDILYLPKFSVSELGATYHWRVRDLPSPAFPQEVTFFYAQLHDSPGAAPWQNVELRIEFVAPNGDQFFRQDVAFSSWKGGGSYTDKGLEVSFYFSESPRSSLETYDIIVTVVRASPKQGDQAQLSGTIWLPD